MISAAALPQDTNNETDDDFAEHLAIGAQDSVTHAQSQSKVSESELVLVDAVRQMLQNIPTGNVEPFTAHETNEACAQLKQICTSLLYEELRTAVVTELFDWARRTKCATGKSSDLRELLSLCILTHLQPKEREELYDIVFHLPPAVLGDKSGSLFLVSYVGIVYIYLLLQLARSVVFL